MEFDSFLFVMSKKSAMSRQKFKKLMFKNGYTNQNFAKMVEISVRSVHLWLDGSNPIPKWAVLIASHNIDQMNFMYRRLPPFPELENRQEELLPA